MGNNLITTSGAIALARAVNETESSEIELLDLTVSTNIWLFEWTSSVLYYWLKTQTHRVTGLLTF